MRAATARPFGVNLFVPSPDRSDRSLLAGYVERVRREAIAYRCESGEPAGGDDGWAEKLSLLVEERPAVVSLAFGCPDDGVVGRLHDAGIEVWVTVTEPEEAEQATAAGADALVVQGVEAGAHRGSFSDVDGAGEIGLITLLRLVTRVTELPLIASGGLCDGAGVAAVLVAGARAASWAPPSSTPVRRAHRRPTAPPCAATGGPCSPGPSAAGALAAWSTASSSATAPSPPPRTLMSTT